MSRSLGQMTNLLLSRIIPPYTHVTMLRHVQKHFDFLFREHGYSIYTCYFDRFDYWDVLLVSHTERLGIWVSSERYVTLYLCLPSKEEEKGFEAKVAPVQEVVATAMNNPALREYCGYRSGERGIKICAQFLKKYYSTLKDFAEQKNWLLEKKCLERISKGALLAGHWQYEEPCWVRAEE